MGIRETLNKNPSITTGVTIGIIAIALIFIIWQVVGSNSASFDARAFYTTDDGATWFDDDATKLSPFDKGGQKAYRVYVFKAGDGKPFAAYLERFTDEALKKMEANNNSNNPDPSVAETVYMTGLEVKRPGAANKWVLMNSPEGERIRNEIKSPDGKTENIEPVSPN